MMTSIANQVTGFPWLKFGHESYLFGEFRAKANTLAKAAFFELYCHAIKQYPVCSIPNDDEVLAGWIEVSVAQWLKVKNLVLSQFSLGDDGRYYCDMLTDLYTDSGDEAPNGHDEAPSQKESKTRSSSAERMQRKREREAAEREALKNKECDAVVTPVTDDVTLNVTPNSVTSDAICDAPSVTSDADVTVCDGNVTQAVVTCDTQTVTNEGVGGDLDLDLDKKIDLDQKNNTEVNTAPTHEQLQSKRKGRKSTIEALTLDNLVGDYQANPQHAKDWLAIREKAKAPLTQTAMEGVIRNADLARITVAQAIQVCATKGWRGFDATWNFADVIPTSARKSKSYEAIETVKEQLIKEGQQEQSTKAFIDGLVKIYGIGLVDSACLSVLANKPLDIPQYLGGFLKTEAKKDKTRIGQVNDAWPVMPAKPADEKDVQKLKEALDEFPY